MMKLIDIILAVAGVIALLFLAFCIGVDEQGLPFLTWEYIPFLGD